MEKKKEARLTASQMRVDAHVPRRPAQALSFPIRNVLLRLRVAVLLRHAEVDDVDHCGRGGGRDRRQPGSTQGPHNRRRPRTVRVLRTGAADEEVVRLDVAVDQVLVVHGLHPGELWTGAAVVRLCAVVQGRRGGDQTAQEERAGGRRAGGIRTRARSGGQRTGADTRTICRAAMQTVLIENLRPHMSKRSSKLGPRRSMTRILCRPSWPKW